jgi:DNA-directed RNA polymerase subunit beta'
VEELFEARVPKEAAILSEIDGTVAITKKKSEYTVRVVSPLVGPAQFSGRQTEEKGLDASMQILLDGAEEMRIGSYEQEVRSYAVPLTRKLAVSHGQQIAAGTPLTTGPLDPREVLRLLGKEAVQQYLVSEVSKVYRMTGVSLHEKHFEVIVREMLRHVQVEEPGDSRLLPGEIVDRFEYTDLNAHILAQGGEPATARTLLLGLTRTALASESWLAAASFQEATRVLTDSVLKGKVDDLQTLKANVMIGRLIPAGTGFRLQ